MDPTLQNGQDPEAIRRAALLAAIMGKTGAPGMPGAPGTPQPATPGFQIPNPTVTNQPSAPVAQPISSAKSPAAKPMATPSTAVEPGNQPPTFQSEEEWNKANPAAAHTPYVAPDLKHRLLTGLFAGMQEFGRPGEGAATVRDYLGNIDKSEDAEKNYADTSAAAQHQRYMTVAQGAEQPLHIQQLQAQIKDTEAQAADRAAQTKERLNPAPKTRLVQIADPTDPKNPIPATQDIASGKIVDQHGTEVPNAKIWEKPAGEKAITTAFELWQKQNPNGKAEDWLKAEQAAKPDPNQKRTASELAQVERETRTTIRKAQETYRTAQNHATLLSNFVDEANKGNKVVAEALPLEGALSITTSQGIKRINRPEVQQFEGAGDLFDRIMGKLGKLTAGQPYPDDLKKDMKSLADVLEHSAYKQYSDSYDDEMGIAKGYGLDLDKKLPRLKHGASSVAGGGALPPGWNPPQQ